MIPKPIQFLKVPFFSPLETFIDANFDAAGAIADCTDKCLITRWFDSCTKKDIVNDIFKAQKQCLITFAFKDQ